MNLFLKKSSKNADKKLNKNFLNGNDMFPKKYFIILLDFITIIKELSKPSVGTCLTLIACIILLVLRSKLVPKKKSAFNCEKYFLIKSIELDLNFLSTTQPFSTAQI